MVTRSLNRIILLMGVAVAILAAAVPRAVAETVLRVSPHSDLKIIDPVWTSALITTHHGYMIYDTLFAFDDAFNVRPQMIDTYVLSDDKLTWTFKLREGLEWHDGAPVTAEDCIASIKRWGAKDGLGQRLLRALAGMEAVDQRTFLLKLKEPYGLVTESLAKSTSNVPFMMPKRVAETDPNTQMRESIGSGPFIFAASEWKPGSRVVYLRNPKYKPRSEPVSGMSGGKVVKVDRVEWVWIADPQTQANALLSGEIDVIEAPPHDLTPLLSSDPNIAFTSMAPLGRQYAFRFNHLYKPFDNPKIRQAVAYAFRQQDFLEATIGDPKYFTVCKSMYPCGSPFASDAGFEDKFEANFAKAKALLAEAGYDGTPVILMQSTDNASLANTAVVAKSLLEKGGFKVDLQAMDWQTLVARRAKRDPPNAGGWNAFITSWGAVDLLDPVTMSFLNASCDKATFGWPCDKELESLRDAFAREADPVKRKEIARAAQVRNAEVLTHLHLGQYVQITAHRKTVTGLYAASNMVLWNVAKQ